MKPVIHKSFSAFEDGVWICYIANSDGPVGLGESPKDAYTDYAFLEEQTKLISKQALS